MKKIKKQELEILIKQKVKERMDQARNKWSNIHIDVGTHDGVQFYVAILDDRHHIFSAVGCLHYGNQDIAATSHKCFGDVFKEVVLEFAYGLREETLCLGWCWLHEGNTHFDDSVGLWVADQTGLKDLFLFDYEFLGIC